MGLRVTPGPCYGPHFYKPPAENPSPPVTATRPPSRGCRDPSLRRAPGPSRSPHPGAGRAGAPDAPERGRLRAAGQWPVSAGLRAEGRGRGQAGRQAAAPPAHSPQLPTLGRPGRPASLSPAPAPARRRGSRSRRLRREASSSRAPRTSRLAPRARACAVRAGRIRAGPEGPRPVRTAGPRPAPGPLLRVGPAAGSALHQPQRARSGRRPHVRSHAARPRAAPLPAGNRRASRPSAWGQLRGCGQAASRG